VLRLARWPQLSFRSLRVATSFFQSLWRRGSPANDGATSTGKLPNHGEPHHEPRQRTRGRRSASQPRHLAHLQTTSPPTAKSQVVARSVPGLFPRIRLLHPMVENISSGRLRSGMPTSHCVLATHEMSRCRGVGPGFTGPNVGRSASKNSKRLPSNAYHRRLLKRRCAGSTPLETHRHLVRPQSSRRRWYPSIARRTATESGNGPSQTIGIAVPKPISPNPQKSSPTGNEMGGSFAVAHVHRPRTSTPCERSPKPIHSRSLLPLATHGPRIVRCLFVPLLGRKNPLEPFPLPFSTSRRNTPRPQRHRRAATARNKCFCVIANTKSAGALRMTLPAITICHRTPVPCSRSNATANGMVRTDSSVVMTKGQK